MDFGVEKLAGELGLRIKEDFAYGYYKNYILSLTKGDGSRTAGIAVAADSDEQINELFSRLPDEEFKRANGIRQINYSKSLVEIIFFDDPDSLEKMRPALELILDLIVESGIRGKGFCSCCKRALYGGSSRIIKLGPYAYSVHADCAELVQKTEKENGKKGNIAAGTVGAALGALVGAVPWAVAYYFGFFVGWLGLLIGLAAKKGYELLRGRDSKAKAAVIIVVTLLTVVYTEYATVFLNFVSEMLVGQEIASDVSLGDLFIYFNELLFSEHKLTLNMIFDIVIGWLFAGIGIFSAVKKIIFSNAKEKVIYIE